MSDRNQSRTRGKEELYSNYIQNMSAIPFPLALVIDYEKELPVWGTLINNNKGDKGKKSVLKMSTALMAEVNE